MNRLSKVFRPFNYEKKSIFQLDILRKPEKTPKGLKLLNNYGFIRQSANGLFFLLPMGYRVIQKLTNLVDNHMSVIGAQKMLSPLIIKESLWQKAGTYERAKNDLYVITDRSNHKFVLSPTHEEAFTELLAHEVLSYRNFPLLLYQITSKFRDELRPKLGFLRSKEFIMKDLYSFDINQENAQKTYAKVTDAYKKIFDSLKIPYQISESLPERDTITSHEYHYACQHGDDQLYICDTCNYSCASSQIKDRRLCPGCSLPIKEESFCNGLEVAHTFNFGTSYSDSLKASYVDNFSKKKSLHMCSYGIGISRIISASAEILSTETELRWPPCIAPYTVCVIPPKDGSRDEIRVELIMPELYSLMENIPNLKNDIIIDDRPNKTIGKRLDEAKACGFSFIVVAGKDATQNVPLFELHDIYNEKRYLMPRSTLLQYLIDNTKYLSEERVKLHYLS